MNLASCKPVAALLPKRTIVRRNGSFIELSKAGPIIFLKHTTFVALKLIHQKYILVIKIYRLCRHGKIISSSTKTAF